jgi:hypothetical protein
VDPIIHIDKDDCDTLDTFENRENAIGEIPGCLFAQALAFHGEVNQSAEREKVYDGVIERNIRYKYRSECFFTWQSVF